MDSNVLVEYPIALERHWEKKGTWMNIPKHDGIHVYISPLEKVDGDSPLFANLREIFKHYLVRDYKIRDNGMLQFVAPPGFRFGLLLGEIARIYDILYEKEAYNRGYTKAVTE